MLCSPASAPVMRIVFPESFKTWSGREVDGTIEVREQSGLRRVPAKRAPGLLARSGDIELGEVREPAEVVGLVSFADAHDGKTQPSSDDLRDFAKFDAFFGYTVVVGRVSGLFQGETKQPRRVQTMYSGPSV